MLGRLFCLALALCWLGTTAPARANDRYAAIVVDHSTREVLHSRRADVPLFPASLTKMMTLYLLFDALDAGRLRLDSRLPVSQRAAGRPPSKLGLKAGSTITVENAIEALIVRSANDVATVVAEALGGTEAEFARMMTRKAGQLGMRNTTFRNASGLPDPKQKSTARDMATLSLRLIDDHRRFYHYFSQRNFSFGGQRINGHNRLAERYNGMDGLKTGYIRASGFNLAATALRDGRRVVVVVFGGRTANSRDKEVARLLDLGFSRLPPVSRSPLLALRPVPRPGSTALAASTAGETTVASTVLDVPVPIARNGAAGVDGVGDIPAPVARPGYAVQVGAFRDADHARRVASSAADLVPQILAGGQIDVSPFVSRKRTIFRARIVGFERAVADEACRILKTQSHDCLVVQTDSAAATDSS